MGSSAEKDVCKGYLVNLVKCKGVNSLIGFWLGLNMFDKVNVAVFAGDTSSRGQE